MDTNTKNIAILLILLILVLLFGCFFVPGFYEMIMRSLQCYQPGVQCVRLVQ